MDRRAIRGLVLVVSGFVCLPGSVLRAADALAVKLTRPMMLTSVYLRPAVYDIHWELQDTAATVTFSRKARTVATVRGAVVTLKKSTPVPTLYFSKEKGGSASIFALGFANTTQGISFPVVRPRRRIQTSDAYLQDLTPDMLPNSTHVPRPVQ